MANETKLATMEAKVQELMFLGLSSQSSKSTQSSALSLLSSPSNGKIIKSGNHISIFASPRIKQLGFAVFGSETHSFRTMKLEGSENSSGATRNFISLEVISTLELGGGGVPE